MDKENQENVVENQSNAQENNIAETNLNEQSSKDTFDKEAFKKELFKEWQEQSEKLRQEAEKTKNMKPDEKAKYELDQKIKDNEIKETELAKRELRLDSHNILVERKLNPKILDVLDYSSKDNCIKSIDTIESILKESLEDAINDRLKGTTPKQAINNSKLSLEDEIKKGLGVK